VNTAAQRDSATPTPLRSHATWLVLGLLAVAVVYLRWQGRVWWCQQQDWSPVSLRINSPHNSQHLFDAYSLSHVLHGVLFFGTLWLLRRRLSLNARAAIAAAIEIVRREPDAHVVVVGCDTGARYLSEPHRWKGA
jgi:hypothetical protein